MHDAEDKGVPENRTRIYEYIQNNPGAHLRTISKVLGLAMGNTQYHLYALENAGQIRSRRIYLHRHYYPLTVHEQDEIIVAFLRKETSRDILIYLLEHPGATQGNIANFKSFSVPTISWHLSRLVESRIVVGNKEGRFVGYFISPDVTNLTGLLKIYHPNIWNKLADRFAELFLELSSRGEEERK